MNNVKGFTLIELMMVVAIIGILAAIAIPAYKEFTIRSKVSEGLVLASDAKLAVSELFTQLINGSPAGYAGSGPSAPNSYSFSFTPTETVNTISIAAIADLASPVMDEGRIEIEYNGSIDAALGSSVVLTPGSASISGARPAQPMALGKPIVWACGVRSNTAYRFVPANCRNLL